VEAGTAVENLPGGIRIEEQLDYTLKRPLEQALERFLNRFQSGDSITPGSGATPADVINGVFGYLGYNAIPLAESISFSSATLSEEEIPAARYALYRYVVAINHKSNSLILIENTVEGLPASRADEVLTLLTTEEAERYPFKRIGEVRSNLTDQAQLDLIERCKTHIRRGDVFQIVLSRKFFQKFQGDDFQVYRTLRRINPSPYLFYFDLGDFHLFGSSPEAQVEIRGKIATVVPIAGTYKRTGDETADRLAAVQLLADPKESAEHAMLVDLARNDLSRGCYPVAVDSYKTVQFFSHVIHLVSHVSGSVHPGRSGISILLDTFPAGTVSGAPKHRAMQLLDEMEPTARTFYGGAVGALGFNGSVLHAMMLRTFLSKADQLTLQAGSGIVFASVPESEVQEVKNKLGALHAAMQQAEELSQ